MAATVLAQAPPSQDQAQALAERAGALEEQGRFEEAIALYQQALKICRDLHVRDGERSILNNLGYTHSSMGKHEEAIPLYEKSLELARAAQDLRSEARTLNNLAAERHVLGRSEEARRDLETARELYHRLGDAKGEADGFNNLGAMELQTGHPEAAIRYYEQALVLWRAAGDKLGEARTTDNLGLAYRNLDQYAKAIGNYEKALALFRLAQNERGEAVALNNLGAVAREQGQFERALRYYEQALALHRRVGEPASEAQTLNNIGAVYQSLHQPRQAMPYYEQALAFFRKAKDPRGQAQALNNLGTAAQDMGDLVNSAAQFEQALALAKTAGDRQAQAIYLANLGTTYRHSDQFEKSRERYEEAGVIYREVKDREGEGLNYSNLGVLYRDMNQIPLALQYYEKALAIARETGNRPDEIAVLKNLMAAWNARGNPLVAIFFGKQAVNVVESIRSGIGGLAKSTQRAYTAGNEGIYRMLGETLIAQGRLPEAQQVLGLLKKEEYAAFVERGGEGLAGRADLTPDESEWAARYRSASERLAGMGARYQELLAKNNRSAADEAAMTALEKDLSAGNQAFQKFLDYLGKQPAPQRSSSGIEIKDVEAFGEDLGELGHGAVALYTLAGRDTLRVILVTPSVRRAYASQISEVELNRKVMQFREKLQNPASDPRPLAEELYRLLIVPALAADLREAKAETLMWSLDGALRYLPVAALHDGSGYLIEKYRMAVFTSASNARLKDPPKPEWKMAGFGVTLGHEQFPALPNVEHELSELVQKTGQSGGVLPGDVLLDQAFTAEAMQTELRRGYPVVHIASHFQFQPGDQNRSFLLTGDGKHLSLGELNAIPNLFRGVDLLTLSACNTGVGASDADGREVEGFGVLAQRKGAKAVIATLWPVADDSTSLLMREFYRIRQDNPGMVKAEALRRTQLGLLHGTIHPEPGGAGQRGSRRLNASAAVSGYSHPYYWAPFFLIGNWL